jgi:hypothetical protein
MRLRWSLVELHGLLAERGSGCVRSRQIENLSI